VPKVFHGRDGVVAAFIFITVPFVSIVMCKTTIELSLAFFETLAVLSFVNFVASTAEDKNKWLILSALFSGTAFAGKYLSVYNAVSIVAALLIYFWINRKTAVSAVYKDCRFILIVAVLVSPFYIRNYFLTECHLSFRIQPET